MGATVAVNVAVGAEVSVAVGVGLGDAVGVGVGSARQSALQPSPSATFPSSHCSPAVVTKPLPQPVGRQLEAAVAVAAVPVVALLARVEGVVAARGVAGQHERGHRVCDGPEVESRDRARQVEVDQSQGQGFAVHRSARRLGDAVR